jgi:hypothetical protein
MQTNLIVIWERLTGLMQAENLYRPGFQPMVCLMPKGYSQWLFDLYLTERIIPNMRVFATVAGKSSANGSGVWYMPAKETIGIVRMDMPAR